MDKFREECNNWNKLSDLIFELTKLVDSSREKEALDLRDRILNDFVKNYSEPMWGYLNLEEQLGCPLEVLCKAIKDGIYTNWDWHYDVFDINAELSHIDNVYYGVNPFGKISIMFGYKKETIIDLKDYKKIWWLKEDKSE